MAWTNDQLRAIKTRGGKILVSAAAGSGKTAVLSERVLDFVLNGGSTSKLLIVTFTEAAAIEMKTRIKMKIESALEDNYSDNLQRELTLIDNASICTMDSFYSKLVKQNFDKLDIMPNFSILTSAEEKLLKNKVALYTMENSFNEEFINLLKTLGANDNSLIKDIIISTSNFFDTIPFYEEFINKVYENYSSNYYKTILISNIKDKFNSYKSLYDSIKEELYNESSDFDKLNDNIMQEDMIINKILSINSFDELSIILRTTSFNRLASIRGYSDNYVYNKYKNIRSKLKKEITDNLSYLINVTDKEYETQNKILLNSLKTLFSVVKTFRGNLLLEKKKINKYSFSDIPLFVIKLLIKDNKKTYLAKSLEKRFDEILIDEYQDTNNLQSIIFNAISKDGSNIFCVGDIKQSIYRFRSACPDIFNNDKLSSYKDKFPMLITLSKNFRSRNLVLDFCNFIFENTMSNYLGETNYDKDEMLYNGMPFPEYDNALSEVCIINNEEKEEDDELTKSQKEAIFVANKIKKLIDDKYQVYDKKGFFRDIRPSDIAILFRNLTHSDTYRIALNNRGIGVYSNKEVNFFDNYDVKLIICILKVIDNYYDDISLISVLKSKLFNIEDSLIAKCKVNYKNLYLYDAIKKSDDKKLNDILDIIYDLSVFKNNNTLTDTINYIYKKLDVINVLGTDKSKLKNLTMMVKNASDYEENTSKSFHEFVSYIEEVLLDKSSFAGANPLSDGDNVLITTIHRSKGLEYPVVFVCETGSQFNNMDLQNSFLIDNNYGISFDILDYDKKFKYEPISKIIMKDKIKLLQLSEELRILYVALTRAREKLIITGFSNNLTNMVKDASYKIGDDRLISNLYLSECNSYLKWIIGCLLRHNDGRALRELSNASCKVFLSDSKFKLDIINALDIKDENLTEKIEYFENKPIIVKDYDYTESKVPVYLSVSELKKKTSSYIRKPYFINSDVRKNDIGTIYHKIFELLDIKKYTLSTLKEKIDELCNNNIISKMELKLIDINKIFMYLTSDIYDMILNSSVVYKEKEITFSLPASYYDIEYKNESILTSGIIDMIFVYDDTYYILDYKSDDINNIEELKERYKIQLDLYEIGVKQLFNAKKVEKIIYSIKLNKFIRV